ncbi:hypothetical protein [Klebsiella pneumoniae]|uniref:hypothetical protein n=1 Tax=Klebsiella pneumoniae TaxID=573 RepID=UPI001158FCCC|nr:hypothetical protein [Klebsiella pneumoniae]
MDLFDLLEGRSLKYVYWFSEEKNICDAEGSIIATIHPEGHAWVVYPRPLLPSGKNLESAGIKVEVSNSGKLQFSIFSLPTTVY